MVVTTDELPAPTSRRSTRERRKPKAIYEVVDPREAAEDEDAGDDGAPDLEVDGVDGEGHDDNDDDDDDGNDGNDEEDDENDEDAEPARVPKRKRAAAKSPKAAKGPRRAAKAAVRPRKLKPVAEERGDGHDDDEGIEGDPHSDDEMFFEAVKRGKCSMSDLMIEWRERFEENADAAVREVLNFVLQACGGQGLCVPTSVPLEKLDMSDLVDYVVGDLEKTNQEYPIASRQKVYKRFRANFADFWEAFVKECYESELLFTTEVVAQFVDWLTTLSSAEVRAIRHTTTIAAYGVASALVECMNTLSQQLTVVQRQLSADTQSKRGKSSTRKSPASSKKNQQLKDNKIMFESRQEKLLEIINLLFNGVVVHRYRDVMPDIRLESIQALGQWISTLPAHFLKDNYMKYLGWVLNDKDATVRLGVVEILLRLYENEDYAEKLELFTSRFLPRFLELCNDVDDSVVQGCIKLLIAVDKRSLISSDVELHSVEKLVFEETNEDIRKAAAEFVCLQYDAFGVAESKSSKELTKEQLNTQAIALVEFAEEYVTNHGVPPEAVETMVDAFWGLEDCQVLQNWKMLTNLLLLDKNAPDLTSEQQTFLIRLLVATVSKTVSQDSDKVSAKKKGSNSKDEIAVMFYKEIPNMLVRFQSDAEKVSLLVELIPLLSLRSDTSGIQTAHVKGLLEKLKHAYLLHSEDALLKALSSSFHHMKKSDHEVTKREADVILHELCHSILDKLEEALEEDEKMCEEQVLMPETPKSKRRSSKKRDLADTAFAVRSALARTKHLTSRINMRDFSPKSKPNASSPGGRRSARQNSIQDSSSCSRLDLVLASVVRLIQRRTKKVIDLNDAHVCADTIKYAMEVLYSDVLWVTQPVFKRLLADGPSESIATSDSDTLAEIDLIRATRSNLESAIISVLEMHLDKKVNNQSNKEFTGSEEIEESQVEMEEISFDDPTLASYVKSAQRCAYFVFCDARCLFVEKFRDSNAPFDALDWSLPKVLVLLTQMYFENEMEREEEQPEDEEVGDDNRDATDRTGNQGIELKAEVLVALARVSQCNPSNKRQAAAVLRYLADHNQQTQDVVKAFSKHIKANAPVRFLEIQMTALRQVFNSVLELKEERDGAEDDDAAVEELQENIESTEFELNLLAKKFSQSLGVGKVASSLRAPFFRFLCEGVRYSLEEPRHFSFLEAFRPYLSHLDKSSTKQLNAFFNQLLEPLQTPTEEEDIAPEWRIVFDFKAAIDNPDGMTKTTTKSPRKKRKSITTTDANDEDEIDNQDADNSNSTARIAKDPSGTSKRARRRLDHDDAAGDQVSNDESANLGAADDQAGRAESEADGGAWMSTRKRSSSLSKVGKSAPSKRQRRSAPVVNSKPSRKTTQLSDDEVEDESAGNEKAASDGEEEIETRRSRRHGRGKQR